MAELGRIPLQDLPAGDWIPLAPNPLFIPTSSVFIPQPGWAGGFSTNPSTLIRNYLHNFYDTLI